MRRIAFFVEGQTEQIFVNRLTKEILGSQRTNIIQKKLKGGTTIPKQEIVRNLSLSRDPWYDVLIYDCGSDNRVKSEMLHNLENLHEQGFDKIVGLRDLYPLPLYELDKLRKGLRFMPSHYKKVIPYFNVIIAVHEVETWFLAEANHYKRIDGRLTGKFIRRHLGFDPYTENPLNRTHPSNDLNNIYKLVNKSYTKRYGTTRRIVNRLNYRNIINHLSYEISSLGELVRVLQSVKRDARRGMLSGNQAGTALANRRKQGEDVGKKRKKILIKRNTNTNLEDGID